MNKYKLLISGVLLCAAMAAQGGAEQMNEHWVRFFVTDAMTDKTTPTWQSASIKNPRVKLLMACKPKSNTLVVMLLTDKILYAPNQTIDVSYRIDKKLANNETWAVSGVRNIAKKQGVYSFINALRHGDSLVIQLNGEVRNYLDTYAYRFNIAEFADVYADIYQHCYD